MHMRYIRAGTLLLAVLVILLLAAPSRVNAGVVRTVSTEGTGPKPKKGDKVTVHCTGYITEGRKKFWSTLDKNEPFSFNVGLGQVIKGWDEGVMQMRVGEKASLAMSSDYAYGAGGFPAWKIGGNAALTFEIELLSVSPK